MLIQLNDELTIEDPRNHSRQVVDTLRELLASGVHVEPDPKRPGFYELENEGEVYYIHISPITGNILLLATWTSEDFARCHTGAAQVA